MKILIIDDEKSIRNILKEIVEMEGHEVSTASNGKEGLDCFASCAFDLVFCDIKMEGMDGVEVLENIMSQPTDAAVVMISGHGDIETAVECMRKGAYDFISKPLDLNRIMVTLKNVADKSHLVKENRILKKKVSGVQEIVGNSEAIQKVRNMIDKVALTDARVLVTGSNGTGKELVARWLHEKSNRSAMPFIEVNCAAIPGELIESELFGHEKGSFTSAIKQHKGKFEQAEGGTLFLDEIGDMSLAAQAKVLRVLQERKLSRVGSDKDINVDVRVIAATNKNLQEEIKKGTFREDLYHRLSVIIIQVPSLAERKDDIPVLVRYFISQICSENGMPERKISEEALEELSNHPWTGNIRELRNVTERLLILGSSEISKDDVLMFATPNM